MADEIRATQRNRLMGLIADALQSANDYASRPDATMPGGVANPPLNMLSQLIGVPALATTANRLSYGEPLTNAGMANVPFLKPETADAAMALAAAAPAVARGALRASDAAVRGITGNPQATAQGVIDYAQSMAPALNPATVWHGSPHKFDAFDASKIGTGEGAQAYGHGLYLADIPAVANEYARMNLTGPGQVAHVAGKGGADSAMQALKTVYPGMPQAWYESALAKASDAGNLYKVDLPDEMIARMLDWDKPLSQQAPGVADAVRQAIKPGYVNGRYIDPFSSGRVGKALMDDLSMLAQKNAPGMMMPEKAMQATGVPGIRYLDGGSRGAGAGTSNYVIFAGEEPALTILERNGQPVNLLQRMGNK